MYKAKIISILENEHGIRTDMQELNSKKILHYYSTKRPLLNIHQVVEFEFDDKFNIKNLNPIKLKSENI
jgi:hypothetical protein